MPPSRSRCSATSSLFVALSMATFAVLFGTRHVDATEHQDGLMLAIATESIVKLLAFLAVGIFVTFSMFGGPGALFVAALQHPQTAALFLREPLGRHARRDHLCRSCPLSCCRGNSMWPWSKTTTRRRSAAPPGCFRSTRLDQLFVVPIAVAGLITFPRADRQRHVRAGAAAAAGLNGHHRRLIGGLSAATAMVIVKSVALSIMVSNDLVMPRCCTGAKPDQRTREYRLAAAHRPAARHLRLSAARLHVLPHGRRCAARLDRPVLLCRHRAARATFFGGLFRAAPMPPAPSPA